MKLLSQTAVVALIRLTTLVTFLTQETLVTSLAQTILATFLTQATLVASLAHLNQLDRRIPGR